VDLLKRIVKKTPLVRDVARAIMRQLAARKTATLDSADYWEDRYRDGRSSGAGSYNRLAQFKADVINQFVAEHAVQSVIEFGSGDGSQLKLACYPSYVGVDISKTAIDATRQLYARDATRTFVHTDELGPEHKAELALSLDVIYHLVEDAVFERYMTLLFQSARHYVIVYSSNDDRQSDSAHVRHRRFTDWVEKNAEDFPQVGFVKNAYPEDVRDIDNTSFADFYFFERVSEASHT
jgi:hypothetical protein